MLRDIALLPVLVLAVAARAPAQATPPSPPSPLPPGLPATTPTTAPAALQEYALADTKIRAGFVPYKSQVVWGEPLEVTFIIENLGPAAVTFEFGGDYRGIGRHDRYKITAKDDQDRDLDDPRANGMRMGGLLIPKTLKSGEKYTDTVDLTAFRTFTKPGVYRLQCAYTLTGPRAPGLPDAPALATVSTAFTLTVLDRTPERAARVLDDLAAQVRAATGDQRNAILNLMLRFGGAEAIDRLEQLAGDALPDLRVAVFMRLAQLPGERALSLPLAGLADPDPVVRAGAAAALGASGQEKAVDALLAAWPTQKGAVAEAILVALGASKSERALPVLSKTIQLAEQPLQLAAVAGLGANGQAKAITLLQQAASGGATADLSVRYKAAFILGNDLRQHLEPEWLWPILLNRHREGPGEPSWYGAISLMRLNAGGRAVGALLACIDWDVPWSSRNWWLLEQGVKPIPGAPEFEYIYDPNRAGTAEEIEKNRALLAKLKPLAEKLPPEFAAASLKPVRPVARVATSTPVGLEPSMVEVSPGTYRIQAGFLQTTQSRNGGSTQYAVPEEYRPLYELASNLAYVIEHPELEKKLGLSAAQVDALRTLALPPAHVEPPADQFELLWNYREAPEGPIKEQARQDILASVEAAAQDYHGKVAAFAGAARKLLTETQIANLKPVVDEAKRSPGTR